MGFALRHSVNTTVWAIVEACGQLRGRFSGLIGLGMIIQLDEYQMNTSLNGFRINNHLSLLVFDYWLMMIYRGTTIAE